MGERELLRALIVRAMMDHMLRTSADLARHRDEVASVQREVLRGLRDRA